MKRITKRQNEVLSYIRGQLREGYVPSLQEIGDHFGLKSTRGVCDHLNALEKKGYIVRDRGKARSIRLLNGENNSKQSTFEIPVRGNIPAGTPFSVEEALTEVIHIGERTLGFKPRSGAFALVVRGDSMTGRGVFDGDTVIVVDDQEPKDGDMVAALIDQECTLKTFVTRKGRTYLKPENPRYKDLYPLEDLQVQGVARTIIRKI